MRLINTVSLKLEEFFETKIPKYAILSHTWADGEISYKDFVKNRNLEAAGWTKIRNCCKFAHDRGHGYVWIDTCCIDKRSSAELSEAINSMYHWYGKAQECYAYLSDVSYDEGFGGEDEKQREDEKEDKRKDERGDQRKDERKEKSEHEDDDHDDDEAYPNGHEDLNEELTYTNGEERHQLPEHIERAFCASKWFTRGWTLQELLVPDHIYFIDRSWGKILGDKKALSDLIGRITQIDLIVLTESFEMHGRLRRHYSVAKRMSWASRRVCTRGEDVAYCLMGIFEVNMPLLYGEGKAFAFRRLQLEIMKNSNDESIFAWKRYHLDGPMSSWPRYGGILAKSPHDFRLSANIQPFGFGQWTARQPYHQTNRGLALQTVLGRPTLSERKQILSFPHDRLYKGILLLPLRCWDSTSNQQIKHLAIVVKSLGPQDYCRVFLHTTVEQQFHHCLDKMFDIRHTKFVGEEELIFLQI